MTQLDSSKKTIIFDFGNVLIDLDFNKCFEAFNEVLGYDFSKGLPPKTEAALHKYERGEINTEAFLWGLQQYKPEAEIREVIAAWNAILGALPKSRFDLLESLRPHYNIAMLSNINDMHEQAIHRHIEKEMHIEDFQAQYFDKVFYSHLIGHRKPEPDCYSFVQEQLAIAPEDILFIDDMEKNIAAAKKAGWHGQVHNPKEDIINNIDRYIFGAFGESSGVAE